VSAAPVVVRFGDEEFAADPDRFVLDLAGPDTAPSGTGPGTLAGAPELVRLPHLEQVSIRYGYDVDPAVLAALPALRWLSLAGARRSTADALSGLLAGRLVELSLDDVVPDDWLDANLDNPLRGWTAFSWEGGRWARAAHDRVRAALAAAADRAAAEEALRAFVEELDEMDQEHPHVIQTAERDLLSDTVWEMGGAAGLDDDVIHDVFDDREW
jgi:hypothetical protein